MQPTVFRTRLIELPPRRDEGKTLRLVRVVVFVFIQTPPPHRSPERILELVILISMEVKKSIQLTTKPLEKLIRNGESLDFRLDQEAWQDLQVGDYIEFWEDFTGWQKEPTDNARKVVVKIEHIYKAPTFKELFEVIEKDFSRLGDKEKLLSGLRSWWSEDKEVNEGVLAFHVILNQN